MVLGELSIGSAASLEGTRNSEILVQFETLLRETGKATGNGVDLDLFRLQ